MFQNDYLKRLILIAQAQTNNETLFYNENLDLLLRAKELLPSGDSSDQKYIFDITIYITIHIWIYKSDCSFCCICLGCFRINFSAGFSIIIPYI